MKDDIWTPFPQSNLLLFTSKFVLWAWFWWALTIIGVFGGIILENIYIFLGPLIILLPSGIVYGVLAFIIKCQNCNKAVTVQPFKLPAYADENKIKGLSGWSGIILNVFFNRKFTCMHCGTKYKIIEGKHT